VVSFISFLISEICDEEEGKFICRQCDSIFCEKCFDFTHRSEKKKLHEKKEIEENFISQNCPRHENKKLELFCVKDEVKCCSLCLDDHKFHEVITLSNATKLYKSELLEFDFQKSLTSLKKKINQIEQEIILKKKELSEKNLILDSFQKISDSIVQEEDVDKILEWRFFLKDKENLSEFKIYACGHNSVGTIGLGDKIDKINKFTEIKKFQNKKIDLISCGVFSCFVYTGK
jgi:transcription initiation factor TFIIIB Brf1 subunit/transcription initiation factor TFIIB